MLSRTEPSNRKTSCCTIASRSRYVRSVKVANVGAVERESGRASDRGTARPGRSPSSCRRRSGRPARRPSRPARSTLKSRTTGRPSRYSNSTSSNRISCTTRGASRASGRSGLSFSIAEHFEHALHRRERSLQLGERVDDVPDRVEQQERVPLERHDVADRRAADEVEIAAVPDDDDVDRRRGAGPRTSRAPSRDGARTAPCAAPCAGRACTRELAHLAAEGAHDANARKRLADAAVDLLRVLAQRPVDRPDAARRRRSS